uniref:NADH-ubiquinone oxidoreductase chain 6 n=1 Tax=Leptopus sp. NKMT019 TaxID=575850 RepID=C5HIR0_9HEMI|nr:NADH dehydrogenase subunit 6 [Leptopus sp. NKMT019]
MTMTMIMIMTSTMFVMMKHPLTMGMMLMMQTIITAMITGYMTKSFWFSYMLTMIMLSGMLVLFMYMASMASNEKFNSPAKMTMIMGTMMITSLTVSMLMDNIMKNKILKSESILSMSNDQSPELLKLFSWEMMPVTVLIVMYLLFTMIVVTYNTNVYEGPMRSKN